MIDETISHYRITKKLGCGGMGMVYKAHDTRLGRTVAIKLLLHALTEDADARARFEREAKAASILNHANICTLYDVDEVNGTPFIVMEYIKGETLREYSKGKPLSNSKLVEFTMQMVNATRAAHYAGIIHRDIKSNNFLITPDRQVKMLDFGLAKINEKCGTAQECNENDITERMLTMPGCIVGTVAYMSPEQVLGFDLDARSDLFSLGVVLYEMSTGVLPFRGPRNAQVYSAILSQNPVPPIKLNPDLLPDLNRIILKLLEKDREHRYQSASEVRSDLSRLKRRETDPQNAAVKATQKAVWKSPRVSEFPQKRALGLLILVLLMTMVFSIEQIYQQNVAAKEIQTVGGTSHSNAPHSP